MAVRTMGGSTKDIMLASPQVLLPSMHDKSQTAAARTVLAIQPGAGDGAQEELAAIGVGPRVGHGQHSGAVMLQGEVFVGEHLAVDGLAAGAVARREVAALPMHAPDSHLDLAGMHQDKAVCTG